MATAPRAVGRQRGAVDMEIRILTLDDAAEWIRLRLEALRAEPEAFSASLEEYESLSLDEVRKRLFGNPGAFVVGSFEEGQLTGMAGYYRERGLKTRHKGHVWGVYVTPKSRGRGVGRQLMQALLERGRSIDGVQQILISVATTQAAAIHLYHSLGFETWGREPRALKVCGRFIDEEYMVLNLKR